MEANMNLSEKQRIAAIARQLIRLLQECDDENFVEKVVDCVVNGDETPIIEEKL